MENEVQTKTIKLFADNFGLEQQEIDPSMELVKDLNLSSLEIADFLVIIENSFHVEIPKEESEKFLTLADVITYVSDHGNFT